MWKQKYKIIKHHNRYFLQNKNKSWLFILAFKIKSQQIWFRNFKMDLRITFA